MVDMKFLGMIPSVYHDAVSGISLTIHYHIDREKSNLTLVGTCADLPLPNSVATQYFSIQCFPIIDFGLKNGHKTL